MVRGTCSGKPALTKRDGQRVHFADGSVETVDAIIYATGYKVSFPFFSSRRGRAPGQ